MRAVFFNGPLVVGDIVSLSLDQVHHLKNVLRLALGTEIAVLNGNGEVGKAKLIKLDKKMANVVIKSVKTHKRQYHVNLFLGCPKREYLGEVFRITTELGIARVYVFECQHSPYMYRPSPHFKRILQNALLQSNNPFFPEIHVIKDIAGSLKDHTYPLFFTVPGRSKKMHIPFERASLGHLGFIVGPEGGFSVEEEELFLSLKSCYALSLSTSILRTVTSVSACFGHLYSFLKIDFD